MDALLLVCRQELAMERSLYCTGIDQPAYPHHVHGGLTTSLLIKVEQQEMTLVLDTVV